MSSILNAVVVGVGRMGQHHARNYAKIEGSKLAAVVDFNMEAAEKVAATYNCKAFKTVDDLLASGLKVDCATVAVPTVHHRGVAEKLIPAGVDVLIEKPLGPSVTDCQAMVDLAKKHGRILQVGHTERFNPATVAFKKYEVHPKFIEVHRISPMTFRSVDVGVVLDMMIHDLDIVNHLVKSPIAEVRAVGVAVIGKYEDIANARLTFRNGCVANLTASRLALRTERRMRLFSPDMYLSVDYQKKAGSIITKTANEEQLSHVREELAGGRITDLQQLDYTKLVKYEDLKIVDAEPVKAELESFQQCVRTRGTPEVSGEDGLAAVDLAIRVTTCIAEHKWDGFTQF